MNAFNLEPFWTLECAGTVVSAAVAGVTEIVRVRATVRTETCTLYRNGTAFDAAPLFPFGSTVTVRRDGAPWFVGRVTSAPGSGEGQVEGASCVLSGPWWYLETLVYRQTRKLQDDTQTGLLGRLVLGQAADGTQSTSGQIIAEVLQSAISAGAPFQIGTVDPDLPLPPAELSNVTCAEVIRRVLGWHPDCVAWFDHGTDLAPTFHCRARGSLPAVTLTVGQAPLTAVHGISARPDLVVPAVVVQYETTKAGKLSVVTDATPSDATGQEFGALVLTIQAGASGQAADGEPGTPGDGGQSAARTGGGSGALAQALLEAYATLPYSGSVGLTEPEAGGGMGAGPSLGLGTTLNLAGSAREEWATMNALVVADETHVANGTTTVRFGSAHAEGGGLAAAWRVVQPGVTG